MSAARYSIGASEIRKLRGARFQVWSKALEHWVDFRVSDDDINEPLGPRQGGEGIGLCAECLHPAGTIPSFLKVFRTDVRERTVRNRFLMDLELSGLHWMLAAMPYGVLPMSKVNGIPIVGHFSRRIQDRAGRVAPSLLSYVEQGQWNLAREERCRFSGQLACAVYALEAVGIVHGDLALGNVLIGSDPQDGAIAGLCDFDGFSHSSQPALPLKIGKMNVRKAGSPGFQYPQLLADLAGDGADACVRTDRFALGALICQMMTWQPKTSDHLKRHELLTTDMIVNRSLAGLPGDLIAAWPEGFSLLQGALLAHRPEEMPGPRSWLAAVGGPPVAPPLLVVRRRTETKEPLHAELKSAAGDLGRLSPELHAVRFRRLESGLELVFDWPAPVFHRRARGFLEETLGPVVLRRGSEAFSNFWEFRLRS